MKKLIWFVLPLLCILTWQVEANARPASFGSGIDICTPPIEPVTLIKPTIITNCTRAGIQEALDNSHGEIVFGCGYDPITIPIDQTLVTSRYTVVLDGRGLVTLDGQNSVKILENPYTTEPNLLVIQNLRFINGRAPDSTDLSQNSGAAITSGHPNTRLHIINSTFSNNHTTSIHQADNQGGAIFSSNSYETIIVGSVFEGNSAGNGGAIGGLATGLLIYNSRFSDNHALDDTTGGVVRGYGGAIHLDGVRNSYNPDSNKTVQVCGSTFTGNSSVRGGGAFASVVSDNYGTKATFTRSTFTDNQAFGLDGSYGQGGAIYHIEDDHAGGRDEDNLEISNTTFRNNRAGKQGGAVWLSLLGTGTIVNTTFEGNSTTAPLNTVGQGGAMAITLGRIGILNSTFANNHAAYQAGAIHGGGDGDPDRVLTLTNTIFYNNTLNVQTEPSDTRWQGYHTNRQFADGGQNIQWPRYRPDYDNDANNWITANPIFADPLLLPLTNNGGFNLTMALDTGSPAIDVATGDCPTTDQRLAPRVDGCDIGAYEYGGAPPIAPPVLDKIVYLPLVVRP